MIYLPPLRRLLLPSLLFLTLILYYKSTVRIPTSRTQLSSFLIRQPQLSSQGERVLVTDIEDYANIVHRNVSEDFLSPPMRLYYPYTELSIKFANGTVTETNVPKPADNPYFAPFTQCPIQPNPVTQHIRLPNPMYNVTLVVKNETENERMGNLNPAILSLPHWSENQYLLVSRVATDGSHQKNLICEANICFVDDKEARPGEQRCTERDLQLQGGAIGMRCATPPATLNVPATPAEDCGKGTYILMDIPGFHDPRVFWTGNGEPLMMVNTQSRYACFGLWVIDLRTLHPNLVKTLSSNPYRPNPGPLMSYGSLTEITRNPRDSRNKIEKNWMFFGDKEHGSYIHYDMGPNKRSFAKLIGGGLSSVNLTDPREIPCLEDAGNPSTEGSWHQGTNSLKLILCDRDDSKCQPNTQNQVFFSVIQHKHKSVYMLPLRYERYIMVWSAEPPFGMLGVSKYPMLLYNETATPYEPEENWQDDKEQQSLVSQGLEGKPNWAGFTYTVSIAWAWGRKMDDPEDKNVGYLDDEVILGVGVDDQSMVFSRVKARDLISCLRACEGRSQRKLNGEDDENPVKFKEANEADELLKAFNKPFEWEEKEEKLPEGEELRKTLESAMQMVTEGDEADTLAVEEKTT